LDHLLKAAAKLEQKEGTSFNHKVHRVSERNEGPKKRDSTPKRQHRGGLVLKHGKKQKNVTVKYFSGKSREGGK